MQERTILRDLEAVLPWWQDVRVCAEDALKSRQPLTGLRVAIICIDLYRFDSISSSASEQAAVLITAGCEVQIVCNNHAGIDSPLIKPREDFNAADYDCVLYHYYVGDPLLETVLNNSTRKAVFYQGITTPPEVYAPYSPEFVETCRQGLAQLDRLQRFDMVISGSDYNVEQMRAAGRQGERRPVARMFPPIISVTRFVQTPRKLGPVPRRILTVSRIFSSKNVEGVVRFAEALVQRTRTATRLTIAGAKCEPSYVERLLADMTTDPLLEVDICLRASDERVRGFYQQADIYACFSHHEGFCIPLVEAMAAGVPVVTHALTAIPQTMGGSGVIVEPFQHEEAAEKIWSVWQDRSALTSLVLGQQVVFERQYKGSGIAGKLIDAIRDLVASQGEAK
ncbi:glycosyltransferase family 4 protein [Paraburkholderia kururiensis]|uniref:Glycosyltransferase family 4 protein n=1 Tax=Paraburkholderia kururiensis TaxID=984307 RepID=A0ABZ0WHT0_9BURK|nr:glycosyltransferase family 4 protein [Paraburkholderia kururiensis]WQD76879.1 glycosyltransferase family 4 protein [Paraburkholderia kururiensis]